MPRDAFSGNAADLLLLDRYRIALGEPLDTDRDESQENLLMIGRSGAFHLCTGWQALLKIHAQLRSGQGAVAHELFGIVGRHHGGLLLPSHSQVSYLIDANGMARPIHFLGTVGDTEGGAPAPTMGDLLKAAAGR